MDRHSIGFLISEEKECSKEDNIWKDEEERGRYRNSKSSIKHLLNEDVEDKEDDESLHIKRLFRSAPSSPERTSNSIVGSGYSKSFDQLPSLSSSLPSKKENPAQVRKVTSYPNLQSTLKKSSPVSVNTWLQSLRAQTYCKILGDTVSLVDEFKKFKCPFSKSCDKRIKGKGNLRRHVEWHLNKIESHFKGKDIPLEPFKFEELFDEFSPSAVVSKPLMNENHSIHAPQRTAYNGQNVSSPLLNNMMFYKQLPSKQIQQHRTLNNNNEHNSSNPINRPDGNHNTYRPMQLQPFSSILSSTIYQERS